MQPSPESEHGPGPGPEADPSSSTNSTDSTTTAAAAAPNKKRWRRNKVACDACHARRVRCDRAFPCSRCVNSQIPCELTRERRKRGRIPRTGQARQAPASNSDRVGAAPASSASPAAASQQRDTATTSATVADNQQDYIPVVTNPLQQRVDSSAASSTVRSPTAARPVLAPSSAPNSSADQRSGPARPDAQPSPRGNHAAGQTTGQIEDWMSGANDFAASTYPFNLLGNMGLPDVTFGTPLDMLGTAEIGGYQLPRSASRQRMNSTSSARSSEMPLKYPVLQPLMPFVEPYLSRTLVCDLLDLYFTSAFSTLMHPVCHHIHCYVVRKASFLSRDNPRTCSPALLASMLWVAALDDRAFALSISPVKRRKLCQFLCALTVRLLRPLIHVSFKDDDVTDHDYRSPSAAYDKTHSFEEGGDDRGLVGPAGSLDDVITYIHVASIVSASEQKAASMRWWHAAFTLARELRLNQEVEATPDLDPSMANGSSNYDYGYADPQRPPPHDYTQTERPSLNCCCTRRPRNGMTEEHREERRRTWWLLYIMDRHLALCYNRPLALLDAECEDLLLPLEEGLWQAGEVHSNSPKPDGPQCLVTGEQTKRRVFPRFSCDDHSIFGFFLPLMTITGELINLNQARNHPMLGLRLQGKEAWDAQVNEVLNQLSIYKASLQSFAAANRAPSSLHDRPPAPAPPASLSPLIIPDPPEAATAAATTDETNMTWHTQTVVAYASYVVHVLHILLMGKWDPVALLEDKDFWTSSPTFAATISHALEAANALEQILHYDPDVSFMPYFFGIQLLQGSFLLLLIVERLQKEAGEGILKACELVIRATESCVVTLNTEYQRNFRQVMRSAVAQARGRPVNHSEIRHRRKAVLALYRWTRNGTGLAL